MSLTSAVIADGSHSLVKDIKDVSLSPLLLLSSILDVPKVLLS